MAKSYSFMKTEPGSWQSPKYIEATKKAIEMIESDTYKGIITDADFWQLTGKTKTGKIAYNGLIISHNGCLKINDALPEEKRFRPEAVTVDKDGYNGSLVYTYMNPAQGIYEVGEVSKANCTNAYSYAMALKRCMDRVILKSSKLAYAGIYSDSEAEEFRNDHADTPKKEEKKEEKAQEPKAEETKVEAEEFDGIILPEGSFENPRAALVAYCKAKGIDILETARLHKLNNDSKAEEFLQALSDLVSIHG